MHDQTQTFTDDYRGYNARKENKESPMRNISTEVLVRLQFTEVGVINSTFSYNLNFAQYYRNNQRQKYLTAIALHALSKF